MLGSTRVLNDDIDIICFNKLLAYSFLEGFLDEVKFEFFLGVFDGCFCEHLCLAVKKLVLLLATQLATVQSLDLNVENFLDSIFVLVKPFTYPSDNILDLANNSLKLLGAFNSL